MYAFVPGWPGQVVWPLMGFAPGDAQPATSAVTTNAAAVQQGNFMMA
jgi:hypothetical protein